MDSPLKWLIINSASEFSPEDINLNIVFKKWLTNLFQIIKIIFGTGCLFWFGKYKDELLSLEILLNPGNQGSTAENTNLVWEAKTLQIITAVGQLKDLIIKKIIRRLS